MISVASVSLFIENSWQDAPTIDANALINEVFPEPVGPTRRHGQPFSTHNARISIVCSCSVSILEGGPLYVVVLPRETNESPTWTVSTPSENVGGRLPSGPTWHSKRLARCFWSVNERRR